jgi:hypothetical protein
MSSPLPVRFRRAAPWLAALLAAACLCLSLQRLRQQRRENAGLDERRARAPSGTRPEGAGSLSGTGDVSPSPEAAGASPPAFVEVDAADHLDGLRDDPGFAPLWHRQQQRIIERQYGYAVASLNLADGDAVRLIGLLTARREAAADARDAAVRMGIVGPQANVAVKQSVDELTGEIEELVGTDAYSGLIELAPTVSTCESLLEGTVGLDLDAKGDPMTKDQLYALAQGYVDAAYAPGSQADPQDCDSSGLTPRLQALLLQVCGQVSPTQANAVRDFLVGQARASRVSAEASPDGEPGN